jgi:hypothetical protein
MVRFALTDPIVARRTLHPTPVAPRLRTPVGRHVVSASDDQTIKVWQLTTHTCRLTHRQARELNSSARPPNVIPR